MRSHIKLGLTIAAMLAIHSSASANLINVKLGAASTGIGPNVTNFDTVASAGANLSVDLTPGVARQLTFYSAALNPSCAAAVCNGTFTRGLNFGFVGAEDVTTAANGVAMYVQSIKDTISSANTVGSSHVLNIGNGGFDMMLSDGEHLSVSVAAQTFDAVGS